MTLLFAYGSNMAGAEMEAWCPEHRFVGSARLDGFRLELRRRSIRWGGGAADIVPAPGESVWGALYEVADGELDRLDRKEGEGFAYRRIEVELADGQRASAYEVIDKEPLEVPCSPEYAELVVAGARERGLPDEWLRELSGISSR
jgi:gamma-glutamylcyclotransferase